MSATVTVQLDDAAADTLDRLAQKTGRSRDLLVAEAVHDYLVINVWQLEKIESGMAAAERGDFATADEISRVRAKFALEP
ncbi:MAG: ribbon-helix-helix protein, CopG family [Beijerinckiaceae bacterium]|nr:ribbon-helix-helix protein, CopG family [Beijerinckiaceae bacterium]